MSILAPTYNQNHFASASPLLTWETYLNEGEITDRYDIIEGVRHLMPAPVMRHQRVQLHLGNAFFAYEQITGRGITVTAPVDVLIRRVPRVQTRQPDVLFVTHETLSAGGGIPVRGPLVVAPEIVVEILSDSDRAQVVSDKLTDYVSIGVQQAWLVRPDEQTVEVLTLSTAGITRAGLYPSDDTAQSALFADLQIAVADILRI